MTKIVSRNGVLGFSPRIGISALRLYPHYGGVYAITSDMNELYEMAPMKNNMEVRRWQEKS